MILCGFCGRDRGKAGVLVAGAAGYICASCVAEVAEVFADLGARARRVARRSFKWHRDEAWATLLREQDGKCALCEAPPADIDHDHDTGFVRGLLCRRCNLHEGDDGNAAFARYAANPPGRGRWVYLLPSGRAKRDEIETMLVGPAAPILDRLMRGRWAT